LLFRRRVLRRFDHVDLESRPVVCVPLGRHHENQAALELHLELPQIRAHSHRPDGFTAQPGYCPDDPPQVLEVDGAHASRWLSSCDSAASGIRSAWMNSEDFELASNGYGVQNDRLPAPAPRPPPPPPPPPRPPPPPPPPPTTRPPPPTPPPHPPTPPPRTPPPPPPPPPPTHQTPPPPPPPPPPETTAPPHAPHAPHR